MVDAKGARWAVLAILLVVLSLGQRLPSFVDVPLDRDEGAYAFIAQQWSRGAALYRDYFDHKPPPVYMAYRLGFAGGGERLAAVRVLFASAAAATALACAVAGWLLHGQAACAALTALAACVFLNSPLVQGETANTETLMVLASAWGACALLHGLRARRTRCVVVAGVCCGTAALAKPVAALETLFFAGWLVTQSARPLPQLLRFAGGVLVPFVAWGSYAVTQGTLAASFDAVVLYNVRYAGGATVPLWARVAAIPIDHGLPLALLWAGVAGCTLTALRADSRPPNFALGWTIAALAGTLAGGRIYDHYYQALVPPMAVALGVSIAAVTHRAPGRAALGATVVAVTLGLWPPVAASWRFATTGAGGDRVDWQLPLATVLRQLTNPTETILVWGAEPYLYFAAERRPVSRFIYTYPLLGDTEQTRRARHELFAAVERQGPAAIVVVKREATAESQQPPVRQILAEGAPFRRLLDGYAPALEAPDFIVFAPAQRPALPWRQRWEAAQAASCGD